MLLHQWDQALALAQSHNYPQAEGLLQQYAGHLLAQHKTLEAVELYRKARVCGGCCAAALYCCWLHASMHHACTHRLSH